MSADGSITRWISELDLGRVSDAQEQLWKRYFRRLVGLARLKLGDTPRMVADEEDVAIAALDSFFEGKARGQYPALRNRNELWPLLAKITANKACDQRHFLAAQKRGGEQQQLEQRRGSSDVFVGWTDALIDTELQPDDLVQICEECDRLMGLLPDDDLRTIARRRLEGYKNSEIAQEIGVMERTIERRLHLIRSIWEAGLRTDDK
jgi:DNA-directed RNA polymerase specialized sigma24 family protein